jgi:hypothetical protein
MKRIMILFLEEEWEALRLLADREHRQIKQQATFLIRKQLQQCGLLPDDLEGVTDDRTNNPC